MKKLIAALLAAALLAVLCGSALADSVYFEGSCNVRTGPGKDYARIGSVADGDVLMYAGETRYDSRGVAWYAVEYGARTGWVSSKYSSLIVLNPNRYDDYDDYDYDYYDDDYTYDAPDGAVIATGDAFIRTAPNRDAPDIGVLKKGNILGMAGGSIAYDERGVAWYNVNYNGYSGWVSSANVALY